MKKLISVFFLLLVIQYSFCETMLVRTRICPVLEYPSTSSSKVDIAYQNELMIILTTDNDFYQVEFKDKIGFVNKNFLSNNETVQVKPPVQISSINVRKRASNFTSSAAAGRGLANENVRDRNNVSFKNYDFDSATWVEEKFSYTTEELLNFWKKEINE